jgi:hypothetical protein
LIVRWGIIGVINLAALATVCATGGAESFSGCLPEFIEAVHDCIKAFLC